MLQRPFDSYNGGKAGNGTYQTIINHIPKCTIFIDAMVGNGGIVSNIMLPDLTVINDINAGLIDAYDCMGHNSIVKENLDYSVLLDKYDIKGSNTFIYFDPPYLKATRKNQKDLYTFDWSESDHDRFICKALTVQSNCMISHYPCSLYDNAFDKWHRLVFSSTTRNGSAIECIYMNYSTPLLLQDYSYVGIDYVDRQRIKRKIAKMIAKLKSLPAHESAAIVNAIVVYGNNNGYTGNEPTKQIH